MRDLLNDFGTISLSSTAETKSTNVIDFGPIDERAAMQTHRTGEQHDSTVVFALTADATAAVNAPKLQHSDDNATFEDLVIGPAIPATAKSGIVLVIPMPKNHKRYVVAAATPGATSSNSLMVWIEPGPAQ
jgi:hypothetical protein